MKSTAAHPRKQSLSVAHSHSEGDAPSSVTKPARLGAIKIEWVRKWSDPIVWVNVAKLDKSWRLDGAYYVGGSALGNETTIPQRYEKFGEWLRDLYRKSETSEIRFVEMPHVGIACDYVHFTDGRHRFAWLRDHGVTALPVTVSRDALAEVRRRFGTKSRNSRFAVASLTPEKRGRP